MAFVPTPNVIQVEIRASVSGERCENRVMIDVFHEPTLADMTSIANIFSTFLAASWIPLLPSTTVITELYLKSLHAQNAPEATFPLPAGSYTGTASSVALPNNVSFCVSLRSNMTGRSARGRLFWLSLPELAVVGNTVDSTYAANVRSAVQQIDVGMTAAGYEWVIVSYRTNNAPRVGGPIYFSVNSVTTVDLTVDSQRRRLPGRGN
jgi:hypothetical protein